MKTLNYRKHQTEPVFVCNAAADPVRRLVTFANLMHAVVGSRKLTVRDSGHPYTMGLSSETFYWISTRQRMMSLSRNHPTKHDALFCRNGRGLRKSFQQLDVLNENTVRCDFFS